MGACFATFYLDGQNFNARLISEGYAHAIRGFRYSKRAAFIRLEEAAKRLGKGPMVPALNPTGPDSPRTDVPAYLRGEILTPLPRDGPSLCDPLTGARRGTDVARPLNVPESRLAPTG